MKQTRHRLGGSGSDGRDSGRAGPEHDVFGGQDNHDDAFDRAMRGLHAQALGTVSPRTHARLRAARTAATLATGHAPARGFGWLLGSGVAAVFALAIGLQLSDPQTTSTAPERTASTERASGIENSSRAMTESEDGEPAFATLDENPDFYLWLASNDDAMPAQWER